MTTALTIDEYESTMTERMINITGIAGDVINIWPYVKELVHEEIISAVVLEKETVEIIYQNQDKTFDHVLLPTDKENIFIVIVVDLLHQKIMGHYRQDLNEVYGVE